jgi:uncharacterized protein YbjT (DUF2867 family)
VGKTALLIGSSGLVGSHCLDYLLADEYYSHVEILVRRPLAVEHPKLIQHELNFEQLNEEVSKIKVNDVYCCLGTTIKIAGSQEAFRAVDFTYPIEIAKLCRANGADQFLLVTALGANPNSSIFYNRVKGEVEASISKLDFKSIYIFQPSLLLGKRPNRRLGEEIGQNISKWLSFVFKGPINKYKPIEAKAVAFAMIQSSKTQLQGTQIIESSQIQAIYTT